VNVPVPIRVLLADDHAAARRSLRLLLDGESDVRVIAEAGDLATVVERVGEHRPHVLVIDLPMPNGSTIDTIRRLRAEIPGTEVVVLTMEDSPAFAQRAIEAGAMGFVLKEHSDGELLEAVRHAARGDEYVSPRIAASSASGPAPSRSGSPSRPPDR
jgi:two-component system response regulator NreC